MTRYSSVLILFLYLCACGGDSPTEAAERSDSDTDLAALAAPTEDTQPVEKAEEAHVEEPPALTRAMVREFLQDPESTSIAGAEEREHLATLVEEVRAEPPVSPEERRLMEAARLMENPEAKKVLSDYMSNLGAATEAIARASGNTDLAVEAAGLDEAFDKELATLQREQAKEAEKLEERERSLMFASPVYRENRLLVEMELLDRGEIRRYRGEALRRWTAELLTSGEEVRIELAFESLAGADEDEVKIPVEELAGLLDGEAVPIRVKALDLIRTHARQCTEIIETLIQTLDDPDYGIRESAGRCLAEMEAEAVAPLTAAFENGNDERQMLIARILGNIGPEARPATDSLAGALEGAGMELRATLLGTLSQIDPVPGPWVGGVVDSLADSNMQLHYAARRLLESLGEDGLPYLVEGFEARDATQRRAAMQMAAEIASQRAQVPAALESFFELGAEDADEEVRRHAKRGLVAAGRSDTGALDQLVADLRGSDQMKKMEALSTLSSLKDKAVQYVDTLLELATDSDPYVSMTAVGTLVNSKAALRKALPELPEVIAKIENQALLMSMHMQLKELGDEGSESVTALEEAMGKTPEGQRYLQMLRQQEALRKQYGGGAGD